MHGGKGSGAPRGNRNAWMHGMRSAAHSARKRAVVRYLRATEHVIRASQLLLRAQKAGWHCDQAEVLLLHSHAAASVALADFAAAEKFRNSREQPHAP